MLRSLRVRLTRPLGTYRTLKTPPASRSPSRSPAVGPRRKGRLSAMDGKVRVPCLPSPPARRHKRSAGSGARFCLADGREGRGGLPEEQVARGRVTAPGRCPAPRDGLTGGSIFRLTVNGHAEPKKGASGALFPSALPFTAGLRAAQKPTHMRARG
jgi:hypothetical protein